MNLKQLSLVELDVRMKTLVQKERDLLHEVLLTIKEIDSRKTYLELGFGSLFDYLTQGIGYSEGSTQRRIDAARLLKELPQIADRIQTGEIKLNQISLLQKAAREVFKTQSVKVSAQDKLDLLTTLSTKNHSESQKEIAAYFDLPVVEQTKQKMQANESVRIEFTLSKEAFEKLKQAQEHMSHSVPNQDLAMFLEHICDKIIKHKTSTRNSAATVAAKTLSTSLKKKVVSQDKCCQYKSPITGKLCGNKWFHQVDHKQSLWAEGKNEIKNLQVLCAQHNKLKYRKEAGIKTQSL